MINNMNAIVRIAGKQYMVKDGAVLDIDKLSGAAGDVVIFSEVLVVTDDDKTTIGTPTVNGARVKATILSQGKGEKISVRRYKSKVRHRRAIGFRSKLTKIQIVSISA